MNPTTSTPAIQGTCTRLNCRPQCGLEVVDSLLRDSGCVRGDEVDSLLDFRWLLRHREDADATLSLFCRLRRAMEDRHYLAFYRLRRWLEHQIDASVRQIANGTESRIPLKLDFYCVEAIRHHALRTAAAPGQTPGASRVRFLFHPQTVPQVAGVLVCPEPG